jgi:nucleotide-binding universal stress UspA family protein
MLPKVLIGFDGSAEGEDALLLGRDLAVALGARPVVATVVRHARHEADEGAAAGEDAFEGAVERFCAPLFATARDRLEGLDVIEKPVVDDSRSQAFYELVDWFEPSMVVIGSTNRGSAKRAMLGSLSLSLLSGVPSAVTIAPHGYSGGRLERIGVALDGGSESRRALAAARALAARSGGRLELITVMKPSHYVLGGLLSDFDPEQFRAFRQGEAEQILEEAAALVGDDVPTERTLLDGDAAEALTEAARDLDLLVVGSRGYGPAKGALLGSVSLKLIGSVPAPVMVVPRGAGFEPLGHLTGEPAAGSADSR